MKNEYLLNKIKELRLTKKDTWGYTDRLENILEELVRRAGDAHSTKLHPLSIDSSTDNCNPRIEHCKITFEGTAPRQALDIFTKIACENRTVTLVLDDIEKDSGQKRPDAEPPKLRPQEQRITAAECSLRVIEFSRDPDFAALIHLTLDNSSDAKAAYGVVSRAIEFGLPLRLVAGEPTTEHTEAHRLVMELIRVRRESDEDEDEARVLDDMRDYYERYKDKP